MAVNSLQHSFLCNNIQTAFSGQKNIGGLRVRIGITIF